MSRYKIPVELVELATHRRLIPFIGAGISSSFRLPGWEDLLRAIAEECESDVPFDEVMRCCQNDMLQVAEFYFLRSAKSIGPIRHVMAKKLTLHTSPLDSAVHVELANLGAPQVYTTNFDEALEATYHALGIPVQVIALPKDVAVADLSRVQLIKYHGDLRFDQTLVLTESSYYERLDFESPMDLKFRSDLLGKSVLFMGYSFRDINIRVVWHKLMRMMKDIPEGDRPPSFIVRLGPNPVLEELYKAVGIQTIVLDSSGQERSADEWSELFGDFMSDLSERVAQDGKIPGTNDDQFLSVSPLRSIEQACERAGNRESEVGWDWTFRLPDAEIAQKVRRAARRRIHRHLGTRVERAVGLLVNSWDAQRTPVWVAQLALQCARFVGPSAAVTEAIAVGLGSSGQRKLILDAGADWGVLLGCKVGGETAMRLINRCERERKLYHEERMSAEPDYDIAYMVEVVMRVALGQLVSPGEAEVRDKAMNEVRNVALLYPAAEALLPIPDGAPEVGEVMREIRAAFEVESDEGEGSGLPF